MSDPRRAPERIDAHQHFWTIERGDYGWLTSAIAPLYQDFLPHHLRPLLDQSAVARTVLIQAAPTEAETEFLLALAARHDWIAGVVGWVDFASPTAVETLSRFAKYQKFLGVRPMLQDIADPEWILRPEHDPVFAALIDRDLTFDALIRPSQLPVIRRLAARFPSLRLVLDHAGKPCVAAPDFADWQTHIAALAADSGAMCKLSGLVTEAVPGSDLSTLAPIWSTLISAFGAKRLIWGSDWPVVTLAADYAQWFALVERWIVGLSRDDQAAILGGNAAAFYRLEARNHG